MRRPSRIPVSILVALALVVGAEVAVRAASGRLPEPLEWPDWEAQNKVEQIDALARNGGASVVFVGSSMVNAAADPALATRLLGASRPAFNAALNGADMRTMEAWMLRVVVPRLRPKTVVIGFSSLEVNDNGLTQDEFYDKLVRSSAGRRALGTAGLIERAEGWAEDRSSLFRYRTILRHPVEAFRGNEGARERAAVARLGTLRFMRTFHLRRYSIPPEFRRRTTDESLRYYAVGGTQTAALERLVRGLLARGIRPVLALMPITEDAIAMHPRGAADYAAFTRAFEACCRTDGVLRIDMRARVGTDTGFYVDPVHLNGKGSARFSETITAFLREEAQQ